MDTDRFIPEPLRQIGRARDRPYHLNHLGYPSNAFLREITSRFAKIEEIIMPAKSNRKPAPKEYAQVEFLDVRLDKSEVELFRTFMNRSVEELQLVIADFVAAGHKTSFTWDERNVCFIAASVCKDPDSPNLDKCLTSRSADWFEATLLNAFKALVIFDGGEWSAVSDRNSWG